MNKVFVSLNTVFLIILFLTLIFSVYSIPKLEISDEETIKINFYELDQIKRSSKNSSSFPSSKTENIDKVKIIRSRKKAIKYMLHISSKDQLNFILGKGNEDYILENNRKIKHNDVVYLENILKNYEHKTIKDC